MTRKPPGPASVRRTAARPAGRRLGARLVAGALIATTTCAAEETPTMSFIENDQLRLGADLAIGGAITWLSTRGGPNMINSHDWGRQIQMSFYSGPTPYEPDGKKPRPNWAALGWNPIQSGDCYGNRSKVLEHRNDGREIYVRCRPMHWPLDDEPARCLYECWYRLDGNRVQVRSRLTNDRRDRTPYPARSQELPAVYTNGPWYKLVAYRGERPFSGADTTVLVDRDDGKGWPWRNFYTPEHWVALLDDGDRGLGVYLPGACLFTGGFAGQPKGRGGAADGQTGYMAPTLPEILDHNIVYTYDYTLIVGSLRDIREYVYEREKNRALPRWAFTQDRQHWICRNGTDAGWPVEGGLRFELGAKRTVLLSPKTFWRAEDAPRLSLRARFRTEARSARLLLQPYDDLDAGDWAQWGPEREKRPQPGPPVAIDFDIVGDGDVRDFSIDLSASAAYRGAMTQVRLVLPTGPGTATIQRVALEGR